MGRKTPTESDGFAPTAEEPDRNFLRPIGAPEHLPEFGKLRGKKVRLSDAAARLSREDLEQIEVDGPDGTIRPWRFVGDGSEIVVTGDTISIP